MNKDWGYFKGKQLKDEYLNLRKVVKFPFDFACSTCLSRPYLTLSPKNVIRAFLDKSAPSVNDYVKFFGSEKCD